MTLDQIKTYGTLALRLFGVAAVVGAVLALGLLGWQWQSSVKVGSVTVTGVHHAPADTLRHLARVDSGTVMERIDAALIADRVERHPWVEQADIVKQRALRTLLISVTERTPAALVVDEAGHPSYYLDPHGYAMPVPDSTGYDVPLVRGLEAEYHPLRNLAPPSLRSVMAELPESGADPLVSEIAVSADSSIELVTTPFATHGAIPVRLGNGRIPAKLRRLRAFAEQVLATESDTPIAEIDLRFDGQIVTREQPLDS